MHFLLCLEILEVMGIEFEHDGMGWNQDSVKFQLLHVVVVIFNIKHLY